MTKKEERRRGEEEEEKKERKQHGEDRTDADQKEKQVDTDIKTSSSDDCSNSKRIHQYATVYTRQ